MQKLWVRLGIGSMMLGLGLVTALSEAKAPVQHLKWKIVHGPSAYFVKTANDFKSEIEARTNGRIVIDLIISKVDANSETVEDVRQTAIEEVHSGEVDIAQVYSFTLARQAQPEFNVFDLPFLFEDNEHATRALEGPVGTRLLASMEKSGLHGLGYTYSGGLLSLLSPRDMSFQKVSDFNGKRIRATGSLNRRRLFENLNARYKEMHVHRSKHSLFRRDDFDAIEINIPDIYHRYARAIESGDNKRPSLNIENIKKLKVTESQHTLLLTVLFMSSKKFAALSAKDRELFLEVAAKVARNERQAVVDHGVKAKEILTKAGVAYTSLSRAEKDALREASAPVYEQFKKELPSGAKLLSEIQALAKSDRKLAKSN